MVSAWPEPPYARPVGVRDGMGAFAFTGTETPTLIIMLRASASVGALFICLKLVSMMAWTRPTVWLASLAHAPLYHGRAGTSYRE